MIGINITSELCLESKTLTFTWEQLLGSTATNYTILSSNCGSCPTTTTNTTVTCTDVPSDGGNCTFSVETDVCGSAVNGTMHVNLTCYMDSRKSKSLTNKNNYIICTHIFEL